MGKGMKVKYTKLFDRIYPYLLTGVIFLIFGISHQSVWFQKDVINLYIRQALIWFPAVLAILLLALGNDFYVAVGEQIAFGVCIAGCLKSRWNCPGSLIFAVILFGMLGIAMVFSRVYQLCRIRFIWISIAFQFILAEISTMLKFYIRSDGQETEKVEWLGIFFLIVCATGVYLYLNRTLSGRYFSMGQIEEKYGNFHPEVIKKVKAGALYIASVLIGVTAFLYFSCSGSTSLVQGSYLNYTILQVLGICGLYRLSKRNLFLRAVLGSLAFVLLHAVEQKLGFGSREDIIVSGFLFLYAMLQRTPRKTGTVSIGQRIRKYAFFSIPVMILAVVFLFRCTGNRETVMKATDQKVKIIMPTLSMEYEASLADRLQKYLRKYGFYNIDCVSYEQDMLTCMEILENCIVEDTDIVCMYPLDDSAAEIQKKVMNAGIGLITIGTESNSYDYLVRMDYKKAGQFIAEMSYSWIMRNLPKNSQIATIGTYINSNMAELTEAMNDRLEELTGDDYEIVEKAILDGTGQDASRYMESLLVRYPDLKVTAAYNDSYALAAAEAFQIMGKDNANTGVFGCGGTSQALEKIAEGSIMKGTVFLGDEARKWADAAYAWKNNSLDGKTGKTFHIPITSTNVNHYQKEQESE